MAGSRRTSAGSDPRPSYDAGAPHGCRRVRGRTRDSSPALGMLRRGRRDRRAAWTETSPTTAARTSWSRPRPRRSTCSTRSPTRSRSRPRHAALDTCATVRPINVSSGEATRYPDFAGEDWPDENERRWPIDVVAGLDRVDRPRRGCCVAHPRRRAGVVHAHPGRLRRPRDDGPRPRLAVGRDRHLGLRGAVLRSRRLGERRQRRCGARSRSRRRTRTPRPRASRRSSCSRTRHPERPPTSPPTTSPPPRTSRACSRSASSTTATPRARCSRALYDQTQGRRRGLWLCLGDRGRRDVAPQLQPGQPRLAHDPARRDAHAAEGEARRGLP